MERIYQAPIEDVWELWTKKEGIESWWGPEFSVEVRKLELRPGGELHYAMTATARAQVDFMKRAGMPTTTEARLTYTEVSPHRRLAYAHLADLIPGVEPYTVNTVVEFHPTDRGVKMVLMLEPMHDEQWTRRSAMGWES